jgi:hypothetical protein
MEAGSTSGHEVLRFRKILIIYFFIFNFQMDIGIWSRDHHAHLPSAGPIVLFISIREEPTTFGFVCLLSRKQVKTLRVTPNVHSERVRRYIITILWLNFKVP